MRERTALMMGSVMAAGVVAGAVTTWLLGLPRLEADPAPAWSTHLWLTLPAMLATLFSTWWHTRGDLMAGLSSKVLATRITGGAFTIFVLAFSVIALVNALSGAEFSASFGLELISTLCSVLFTGLIATAVLYLPAFLAEYVVILLVRRSPMRNLLSGVVQ